MLVGYCENAFDFLFGRRVESASLAAADRIYRGELQLVVIVGRQCEKIVIIVFVIIFRVR